MDAVMSKVMGVVSRKENLIHMFLAGALVTLGFRSSEQQRQIEALEAERSSIRSGNKAMIASMWEWRQHFFNLAEADPSSAPLPLARLRAIYGEDEPPAATSLAHPGAVQGLGVDADGESVPIS